MILRLPLVKFVLSVTLALTLIASRESIAAPINKILVVGDSLSQHLPSPTFGWNGSWGMAASAEDKDYVHLVLKKVTEQQNAKPELLVMAKGGGTLGGQIPMVQVMTDFKPDLAIVQMGENDRQVNDEGFRKPYAQILEAIKKGNPQARILCLGVWSPPSGSIEKDAMIRKACQDAKAEFIDIRSLNEDLQAKAKSEGRFTNDGVNWHPGDAGMAKFADLICRTLYNEPGTTGTEPSSAKTGAVNALDEKWEAETKVAWIPKAPPTEVNQASRVAKIASSVAGGSNVIFAVLDPASIAGKWITVATRVKGDGITARPNSYNGVKIGIHLKNAEGVDDYPQVDSLPDGTFDWTEVNWRLRVPDNIVSAELGIGLENVQGTLLVAPLSITVEKE